ncbi:MAG TPA: hypothetical protein VF777_14280 [Phycisphaerales bacterium]
MPIDDADQIIADLRAGRANDIVVLAVPSHTKENQPVSNQSMWAEEALSLFADLYGGATAFAAFKGVYVDSTGNKLWDNPILVESLAERSNVEDRIRLKKLLAFALRMKTHLRQDAVMIVFNDLARFV